MNIQKRLAPYFIFTQSERRGILVLIIIMVLLIGIKIYLPFYYNSKEPTKVELLGNFEALTGSKYNNPGESSNSYDDYGVESSSGYVNLKLNEAQKQELTVAGFSNYVAGNIIKYREKGGIFYCKNDLLKIYGLDTIKLNKIEKKVILVYASNNTTEDNLITESKLLIELNTADTSDLILLEGIGPVISGRIIKYRTLLGGFAEFNQLKEVYGINEELLIKLSGKIEIDTTFLKKINVNSADESTLAKHPYISNYQAKAIIKYRNSIGRILQKNILLENNIFTPEEFLRIDSYLSVN